MDLIAILGGNIDGVDGDALILDGDDQSEDIDDENEEEDELPELLEFDEGDGEA